MPIEAAASDFSTETEEEKKSIELLRQRLSNFETEQGRLQGLSYRPRPNDVGITTTPKAGTTWMQQICHQLRTARLVSDKLQHGEVRKPPVESDMSFSEISEVVPWLELAFDQGQDLEAEQIPPGAIMSPTDNTTPHTTENPLSHLRFFKTHAWAEHCPPFGKTIVVVRHPYDVVVSFYHFFEDWFFESGAMKLETFVNNFWLARDRPTSRMQNASYFVHLISWYQRKFNKQSVGNKNENVDSSILFVFYEDMREDLEKQVRRVANFLCMAGNGRGDAQAPSIDDRIIELATMKSTYEFMKEHENQFDEKLSKLARNQACGLPPDAGMQRSKLRKGGGTSDSASSSAGSATLSENLKAKIDQKWKDIVQPVTNCATYDDFRRLMNEKEA